jgi:hypothetical protein
MKRIVLVTLAALLIGGCGFLPTPTVQPPQAIQESPTAPPVETETALPTELSAPTTEAFFPTPDIALNPTITAIPSDLPADALMTTPVTATLEATVTVGALTNTPPPVSFPSSVTPTPTNGILTYGTLPPAVPSTTVKLWNKSKAEAYISLQQQDGKQAIIEYPVKGQVNVDVPLGSYIYVAWVGGKKMTGSFRLGIYDSMTIFLLKGKVVIEK